MAKLETTTPPMIYVGSLGPQENSYRRMRALITLGLEVLPVDTSGSSKNWAIALAEKLLARLGAPPDWSSINTQVLRAVDTGKYRLLWVDGGGKLRRSTLVQAKNKMPMLIICHYNSDNAFGRLSSHWRSFRTTIPDYDVHFVPTQRNIKEYTEVGARRAIRLKRGYCSASHRPTPLDDEDEHRYDSDILFIGHWEPEREARIASLIRGGSKVKVIGSKLQWIRGRYWRIIKDHFHPGPVVGTEYAKAICAARIVLNFFSKWNLDTENSRMYEIPACGSFMLCERNEENVHVFEEGVEAEFFSSEEELISKSLYYLAHSTERQRIASAGHNKCVTAGYDYVSRMDWMLGLIADEIS